jgi:hypothetical protein
MDGRSLPRERPFRLLINDPGNESHLIALFDQLARCLSEENARGVAIARDVVLANDGATNSIGPESASAGGLRHTPAATSHGVVCRFGREVEDNSRFRSAIMRAKYCRPRLNLTRFRSACRVRCVGLFHWLAISTPRRGPRAERSILRASLKLLMHSSLSSDRSRFSVSSIDSGAARALPESVFSGRSVVADRLEG